jgi:SAM-dependent methyltransferase
MSEHGHGHHEHGHHQHGHDFDWEAMAERLELDAAITAPIVDQVLAGLDSAAIGTVLDVGCGPGAVAVQLARLLPDAHVTALDSNAALLHRAEHHAQRAGVSHRVRTVVGDLATELPDGGPVDLVWAGMVLHHVADPAAVLRRLLAVLRPGGTLVMVEFGDVPLVLPADDALVADGTWQRFQAATTASLNERLGLDPVAIDWSERLRVAGFTDVTDGGVVAAHPAPLDHLPRTWLTRHVRAGLEMAANRLTDPDASRLRRFADDAATRDDLFVHAARRVLTARRP